MSKKKDAVIVIVMFLLVAVSLFVKIVVTVFTLPISVLYSLVVPG